MISLRNFIMSIINPTERSQTADTYKLLDQQTGMVAMNALAVQ